MKSVLQKKLVWTEKKGPQKTTEKGAKIGISHLALRTDVGVCSASSSQVILSALLIVHIRAPLSVILGHSLKIVVPGHRGHIRSGHSSSRSIVSRQEIILLSSSDGGLSSIYANEAWQVRIRPKSEPKESWD